VSRVVLVVYEGFQPLDLVGPHEVFTHASALTAGRYECQIWTTSVCTGAALLHASGVARGRRVATHFAYEDRLEAAGDVTVVRDARYVVDGHVVTSQGVSAGIDMALWLVGRLHGREHARQVRRYVQYEPAPPFLADEPLA
jgi:transcriptional regulator GlxA family with amidase domain